MYFIHVSAVMLAKGEERKRERETERIPKRGVLVSAVQPEVEEERRLSLSQLTPASLVYLLNLALLK